jgi:hypothetical protein
MIPAMRIVVIVLFVALLGTAIATFAGAFDRERPAPVVEQPPNHPADRPANVAPEPVRSSVPARPAPPIDEPGTPEPTPPANALAPADGVVVALDVLDRATGLPVPTFRYLLDTPGAPRADREVAGAHTELVLPHGSVTTLRVEANGYVPAAPIALEFAPAEMRRAVRVPLEPAPVAVGVTLDVRDPAGQPVSRVKVRALWRALDTAADAPFEPAWERSSQSADGRYRLPDLAAGSYRLHVSAIDADFQPLPLVPHVAALTFYGSEQVEVRVDLAPGAIVTLELRDAAGNPLGRDVAMRLEDHAGTAIETRWRWRADAEILEAIDMLPNAGRCTLVDPLPPGRYELLTRRGDGPVVRHPFVLAAGQRQDLTVTL